MYDVKNQIIGCIHAGWKGAYKNIIKKTIYKIKKINSKNLIYACVGPCIAQRNYEVDLDFFKKFIRATNKNRKYFLDKKNNKKLFNLRKFVTTIFSNIKLELIRWIKILFPKISFFSYRRSRKLYEKIMVDAFLQFVCLNFINWKDIEIRYKWTHFMKILSGTSNLKLSRNIAKNLKLKLINTNIRRFADGEIYIEINENIRGNSVFVIHLPRTLPMII